VKYALLALTVLVMVAGSASALSVSYDQSIGLTDTHWNQTMDFTQWNPATYAGYTLTQVDIALDGGVYNSASWAITAGTDVTFSASVDALIQAYRTWGGLGLLVQTTPTGSVSHGPFDAPQSGNDTILDSTLPSLYSTTLTGDLSAFTGISTVGINVDATGTQGYMIMGTDAAGSCVFDTTEASAHAKVTYTYQKDIPEPATMGMFLLGLVGLGAAARRRRDGSA
jgi:hypothetical protein